ncbi:MAG: RdgB/HAM1 family non-canonical purine NTP pyrophosphatase [Acidimicrobiia bacterium]
MRERVVLATANPDKAREITDILGTARPDLVFVPRPTDVADVEETGDTLAENARLKASALADATGLPAIADDTGLVVDALGGAPGVHSARYAGEDATYAENVAHLLSQLARAGADEKAARTAVFATVVLVRWPDGREVAATGEVSGTIAAEGRGSEGFGYDPVFVPEEGDGRTFAEMTPAEKNALSHRGRALRTLAEGLRVVAVAEARNGDTADGETRDGAGGDDVR